MTLIGHLGDRIHTYLKALGWQSIWLDFGCYSWIYAWMEMRVETRSDLCVEDNFVVMVMATTVIKG